MQQKQKRIYKSTNHLVISHEPPPARSGRRIEAVKALVPKPERGGQTAKGGWEDRKSDIGQHIAEATNVVATITKSSEDE